MEEVLSYQAGYMAGYEDSAALTLVPTVLGALLIISLFVHKRSPKSLSVIRIVLISLHLYSGLLYSSWAILVLSVLYSLLLSFNFESLSDQDLDFSIDYFQYSFSNLSTCLPVPLFFSGLLPESNSFPAPYILSTFTFCIVSRLNFVFRKKTNRSAVRIHMMLLKYIPCAIALVNSVIVSYFDEKLYFDHTLCMIILCLAFRNKSEVIEVIKPAKIVRPTIEEKIKVFEDRPGNDGGKQGKSPLPYYMDDDGDIANEFYEEKDNKFVKISESKLKLV